MYNGHSTLAHESIDAIGCRSILLIIKTEQPKQGTTWDYIVNANKWIVNLILSPARICTDKMHSIHNTDVSHLLSTERRSCLRFCRYMLSWGVEVCSPLWEGSRAVRQGWSRTSWRNTERSAHLLETLRSPHSSYTSTSTHVTLCLIMGKNFFFLSTNVSFTSHNSHTSNQVIHIRF